VYRVLKQSVTLEFVLVCFVRFSELTAVISLNSVNRLIFVTVKCGVFFAVRTELLKIIKASFDFKGLVIMYYEYF
jgi:hypothetical protein